MRYTVKFDVSPDGGVVTKETAASVHMSATDYQQCHSRHKTQKTSAPTTSTGNAVSYRSHAPAGTACTSTHTHTHTYTHSYPSEHAMSSAEKVAAARKRLAEKRAAEERAVLARYTHKRE